MITLGTDPEVFVADRNGDIVPAQTVMNSIIETISGRIIVDGVAMEFQPRPSDDPDQVIDDLRQLIHIGADISGEADKVLIFTPEARFDLAWVNRYPELGQFGCSPDISIWGETCIPKGINAAQHPFRYAGCHIHIGVVGDPLYFVPEDKLNMAVKTLDRTVGLAAMIIAGGHDARRRAIYGRPGIYRHQKWGLEYRTPSNVILRSPETMRFIFQLTKIAIEDLSGESKTLQAVIPDDVLLAALRSENMVLATEMYRRVKHVFGLPKLVYPPSYWKWGYEKKESGDSPNKNKINLGDYLYHNAPFSI